AMRGTGTPMPPTDPLIYRFYELVMVNGPAWKALIEEEFGDGIMSAIDFDMAIERQPDPKGDRVKIGMTGKFLPFKYYGATGNALAYGLKEEWTSAFAFSRRPLRLAVDQHLWPDVGHSRSTGEGHGDAELFLKNVDCLGDACLAGSAESIDVSASNQAGACTQRQGTQNISTRANAAIE